MRDLLNVLNASHGKVHAAVSAAVEAGAADKVPDTYMLHPRLAPSLGPAARDRARRVLADTANNLLPHGTAHAVALVEPELDDAEFVEAVRRIPESSTIGQLLDNAPHRESCIVGATLGERHFFSAYVAERLPQPPRSLVLRALSRQPVSFSLRGERLRRLIGDGALRRASERMMREAAEPTDVVTALALLPGTEAIEHLRRVVRIADGLRWDEATRLRERTWNCICSRANLVSLLDPLSVRRALAEPRIGTSNHCLLLRRHRDVAPDLATEVFDRDDLTPRFALDALRAAGEHREGLIMRTLTHAERAKLATADTARVSAAIVVARDLGLVDRDRLGQLAGDVDMPAPVRVIAAAAGGEAALGDDPVAVRYWLWARSRPSPGRDRAIELLSGAWLERVLL
jgi:hypothetical protein